MKTARFNIDKFGVPLLKFESEVHISDQTNENNTTVIKSGYGDVQPTLILASEILNILNNGYST